MFLISSILLSIVIYPAFLTAPILGSIYIGALKPLGSAFPLLTADFGSPCCELTRQSNISTRLPPGVEGGHLSAMQGVNSAR